MGFNISGLFQNPNIANQNDASDVTQVSKNGQKTVSGTNQTLSHLKPGSSISGQVVSTEQGNVTLKLSDSSYVTAALKGNISLQPGSQVSFLVNSNHNHQVSLSPLFTNLLSASPSVEHALNAASLPVNERSAAMVTQMMEQGMGIDKDSLQAMYKEVAANPNIDSGMVVRLSKMNLAITQINAEQLQSYDNLNHQILGSIENITKGFLDAFSQLSQSDSGKSLQLFGQLVSLLTDGEQGQMPNADALSNQAVVSKNDQAPAMGADSMLHTKASLEAQDALLKAMDMSETKTQPEVKNPEMMLSDTKLYAEIGKEDLHRLMQTLSKDAPEALKAFTDTFSKADLSSADTLKFMEQLINTHKLDAKILSEPAIGKMLQNALEEKWLLRPEDVADKEKMNSFYEQLKQQTNKLAEASLSSLGKNAMLTQSTTQLSQNIDFMNQLNQTFTYVQIPLKMSSQNANGDLYVYTNKKHLSAKDGSVSAFLHLDMTHLGSVDCYVTMQSDKVSTNFKVRDDAILDLIEEHIDLLNERLQKRGYSLNATVAITEEETSVMEEMEKQLGAGYVPISKVSFDARA